MQKTRINGYFTVEAALIFPFVIAVILLVMYIWFYLYDSCLMDQDFAGVLMKGTAVQHVSNDERIEYIETKVKNLYREQYVFWDWGNFTTKISGGKIEISVSGSLSFPFKELNFWNDENTWETDRSYSSAILKSVFIIRTFRKFTGLIDG